MERLFTVRFTVYPRPDEAPFSWWAGFTANTYDEMTHLLGRPSMLQVIEDFRTGRNSAVIDVQIVELEIKGITDYTF